jgi:PEP-CTERM motif
MYSCVRTALVVACVALVPTVAVADTIHVGDTVRFLSSDGTIGGGAFHLDDLASGPGFDFLSFCVQRSEYLDFTSTFKVGGINAYADDAAGADVLSAETRWIYKGFRTGTLTGYSSDEIQAAIWTLEDEWNTTVGNSAKLITLAHTAVAGGASGDGVKVLNLFYANGTKAQDQLTFTAIPEPASLMLVGLGLLAAAHRRRRIQLR